MPGRPSYVLSLSLAAILSICTALHGDEENPCSALVQDVMHGRLAISSRLLEIPENGDLAKRGAILHGSEMQEALLWMEAYFAVQVEFSEEDVATFYTHLRQVSTVELEAFLLRFQRMRGSLHDHKRASERLRQHRLQVNRYALRRDDTAHRTMARRASHGGVNRYFGYRPNYSATINFARSKQASRGRYGQVIRLPLITSLDVARIVVLRAFW